MPRQLRTGDDCSGKFRVRIPKKLHAELVNEAIEQDISLNSYVIYLLSTRYGQIVGYREAEANHAQRESEKLLGQKSQSSCLTVGDSDEQSITIKTSTKNKEFF